MSPPAAAAREDALERLLGDVAVSVRSQHRILATADEAVALEPGALSLIYVLAGEVRLSGDGGLADAFTTGDALLSSGQRATTLRIAAGSRVLVSRLALAAGAVHLGTLLPPIAWIRRFDDLEPAAAALARHMGVEAPDRHVERDGDMVICRMMATMLVQSMIRAWAAIGCAPEGWPSRTGDLFLDRVLVAVGDDPGREWTVEQMASVAALSRSVFAARFHAALGQSPASYVTEVRMESAKGMLDAGQSVSETSRRLGYGSDEGFSRAFRRATGVTPSRWRVREASPVPA
ncbi:helix-turn-helix transcriptional regulator [Microbacterium abyssi]|uniref:helix-turn-helix transcriptional regulator n=1 Tax=Microbacterium abyssi TaxID=2782166 RepID=UPI0018898BE9|nr:AraC family transcriptional regulator [Microbacterium sp. A18JL241]